jgi:hypothetical protein
LLSQRRPESSSTHGVKSTPPIAMWMCPMRVCSLFVSDGLGVTGGQVGLPGGSSGTGTWP